MAGFTTNPNPYGGSVLDAKGSPFDFRRQSQATGNRAQASAWDANNRSAQAAALAEAQAAIGGVDDGFQKETRDAITRLTEGRADAIGNDKYLNDANDFFGGVMSGANVPWTKEVQTAQLNQQANGTAAANGAQLRALEEAIVANGGSLQDPSFLAKKQELMANRQGANLDAMGKMMSHANLENFDARTRAARDLVSARGAQNNQVNQMGLAGAGYRAQDFRDTQRPTAGAGNGSSASSSSGWTNIGGGGSTQRFMTPYLAGQNVASPVGGNRLGQPRQPVAQPAAPKTMQTQQPVNTARSIPTNYSWTGSGWQAAPPTQMPPNQAPKTQTFGTPTRRPLGPNEY